MDIDLQYYLDLALSACPFNPIGYGLRCSFCGTSNTMYSSLLTDIIGENKQNIWICSYSHVFMPKYIIEE